MPIHLLPALGHAALSLGHLALSSLPKVVWGKALKTVSDSVEENALKAGADSVQAKIAGVQTVMQIRTIVEPFYFPVMDISTSIEISKLQAKRLGDSQAVQAIETLQNVKKGVDISLTVLSNVEIVADDFLDTLHEQVDSGNG
jgi:hypothetical protein